MNKAEQWLPPAFLSLMFLLASAYLYCIAMPLLADPDVPWHIAAGDLIRASGLAQRDPWSFTAGNQPWYNISWLWDVGLSWLYHALGAKTVFVFTCLLTAGILALLARE